MSAESDKLFLHKADGLDCVAYQLGIIKMIEGLLVDVNIFFIFFLIFSLRRTVESKSSGTCTLWPLDNKSMCVPPLQAIGAIEGVILATSLHTHQEA